MNSGLNYVERLLVDKKLARPRKTGRSIRADVGGEPGPRAVIKSAKARVATPANGGG